MRTSQARRRLLKVLLGLGAVTAVLWAVVLLDLLDGVALSMVRALAWVMLALTGGTAIGLRDANRAMERGMQTPDRPRREPPEDPQP